jgi:hypothetical protein
MRPRLGSRWAPFDQPGGRAGGAEAVSMSVDLVNQVAEENGGLGLMCNNAGIAVGGLATSSSRQPGKCC